MDLVLVRAGRTAWDDQRRLQGRLDIPLSSEGKEEVESAFFNAPNLGVKEILTSGALSALQTAQIISSAVDRPLRKLDGFEEVDLGMWQGLRVGELKHRHNRVWAVWKRSPLAVVPPGGEWLGDAYGRLVGTLEALFLQQGKSGSVALALPAMAHGLIVCYLKDTGPKKFWEEEGRGFRWDRFKV